MVRQRVGGYDKVRFAPRCGGHAPGHLREGYIELVEDRFGRPAKDSLVEVDGESKDLRWFTGQLWNCTDIVPSDTCDLLDIRSGSSFAQAARM